MYSVRLKALPLCGFTFIYAEIKSNSNIAYQHDGSGVELGLYSKVGSDFSSLPLGVQYRLSVVIYNLALCSFM